MRAGVPKRWVAVARKAQYGDDGAGAGSVCCWAGSVCLFSQAGVGVVARNGYMAGGTVDEIIRFVNGRTAHVVRASHDTDVHEILSALSLGSPKALVVISGGAGGMSEDEINCVRPLFVDGLARLAAQERIAILDGGTSAGVMVLTGEGAARYGLTAPLIGVCPAAKVSWPGHPNPEAEAELEPHHSHFVFLEGPEFGTESGTIYAMADALGAQMPSVALVVNGGPIVYDEVLRNAKQGRELIVLKGSGRAADVIAAAWETSQFDDPRIAETVRRGKIVLFDVAEGPERLSCLIRQRLWRQTP